MSFRRRLVLLSAAAVAVAIVVASAVVYLAVRSELRSQIDDDLRADASGEISFAVPVPGPALKEAPRDKDPRTSDLVGPAPFALGAKKVVLPRGPLGAPEALAQVGSDDAGVIRPEGVRISLPAGDAAREVAAGEREPFFSDVTVGGVNLRVYTAQFAPGQAIQVARPLEDVDDALKQLLLTLALVSGAGIALAAGLGLLVSRAALAPVARLSRVAESVAETRDLSTRLTESGDDELARLARSFNRMLAELEQSVESQRQLVADASHELRTPLTSLRTNIELLGRVGELSAPERERTIAAIVAQLDELTVLVSDLVDLARDAGRDEELETVRLDALVEEITERAGRHASGVRFDFAGEPCVADGYPSMLERAVYNLLDNAAKWSPDGGLVEVRVSEAGEIGVRDRGPGIPPEDLPHVFDRFYRSPGARGLPGSGLGLAIVKQVAEAHGGTVSAENAPDGGALLKLRVPVRAGELAAEAS